MNTTMTQSEHIQEAILANAAVNSLRFSDIPAKEAQEILGYALEGSVEAKALVLKVFSNIVVNACSRFLGENCRMEVILDKANKALLQSLELMSSFGEYSLNVFQSLAKVQVKLSLNELSNNTKMSYAA
ncbi:hypothetical protein N9R79_04150 [Vibrio sp.]|nr:hypothetical protein [Vibrio sp.]